MTSTVRKSTTPHKRKRRQATRASRTTTPHNLSFIMKELQTISANQQTMRDTINKLTKDMKEIKKTITEESTATSRSPSGMYMGGGSKKKQSKKKKKQSKKRKKSYRKRR